MQYLTLLSLLPAVMAAGYGSSDSSSSSDSSNKATGNSTSSIPGIHVVKVGQNGLTFEPDSMTVPVGQTVEFHFWPKAHSVARSSFDAPCRPLNTTSFFSGPVQIASGMSPTVFSITVNDTTPIWFYCATGSHCQSGMGGVINPPTANQTRTITNYKSLAAQAQSNVAPAAIQGGKLGAAATSSPTTTGTATGSGTGSAATPTNSNAAPKGAISWGLLGAAGLVGAAFV